MTKAYAKGRRKEYKICRELKEKGFDIVQRTAGSHSPVDIFAIHQKKKIILFVQAKPDNFPQSQSRRIYKELEYLKGLWRVIFTVK